MDSQVINQKFFRDRQGKIHSIDMMPMNKDSWQSGIQSGWIAISEDEMIEMSNPKSTKEQSIRMAEEKKQFLITEANQKTQLWQTQLLLGIITDEDKASLTEWMLYVQKVQAVDTSTAPDIIWPEKPE